MLAMLALLLAAQPAPADAAGNDRDMLRAVRAQDDRGAAWARESDAARLADAVSLFRTICVENAGSPEGQLAAIPSTSVRHYPDRLEGSGYWSGNIQVIPQIGDTVGCGVHWHGAIRTGEQEVIAALIGALDPDWGPEQVYRSPELYAWTLRNGDEALYISFMIETWNTWSGDVELERIDGSSRSAIHRI